MKGIDISKFAKSVQKQAIKHSPEILTGIGIAGMFASVVMAVKATPKVLELIENEKEQQSREVRQEMQNNKLYVDKLTKMEIVKIAWKHYVPTTIMLGLSTTCLISANRVSGARNAALATAYALSESALKEYKQKTLEIAGPKKEQAVRDAVAKSKVEKHPPTKDNTIVVSGGKGDTKCYDATRGIYFKSDIETLRKIENDLNFRLRQEMDIPLNDFYYELGMPSVAMGNILGWHIDNGPIEFDYSYQGDESGNPCLVLTYRMDVISS
jgi:hypothetical protein